MYTRGGSNLAFCTIASVKQPSFLEEWVSILVQYRKLYSTENYTVHVFLSTFLMTNEII